MGSDDTAAANQAWDYAEAIGRARHVRDTAKLLKQTDDAWRTANIRQERSDRAIAELLGTPGKGFNQAQLAAMFNMTRQTLSRRVQRHLEREVSC